MFTHTAAGGGRRALPRTPAQGGASALAARQLASPTVRDLTGGEGEGGDRQREGGRRQDSLHHLVLETTHRHTGHILVAGSTSLRPAHVQGEGNRSPRLAEEDCQRTGERVLKPLRSFHAQDLKGGGGEDRTRLQPSQLSTHGGHEAMRAREQKSQKGQACAVKRSLISRGPLVHRPT